MKNLISCFLLLLPVQIRISVSDQGQPPRTATNQAVVNVTIIRNQQAPIFFSAEYRVTIQETASIGTSVQTVSASDADTSVSFLKQIILLYTPQLKKTVMYIIVWIFQASLALL